VLFVFKADITYLRANW